MKIPAGWRRYRWDEKNGVLREVTAYPLVFMPCSLPENLIDKHLTYVEDMLKAWRNKPSVKTSPFVNDAEHDRLARQAVELTEEDLQFADEFPLDTDRIKAAWRELDIGHIDFKYSPRGPFDMTSRCPECGRIGRMKK